MALWIDWKHRMWECLWIQNAACIGREANRPDSSREDLGMWKRKKAGRDLSQPLIHSKKVFNER